MGKRDTEEKASKRRKTSIDKEVPIKDENFENKKTDKKSKDKETTKSTKEEKKVKEEKREKKKEKKEIKEEEDKESKEGEGDNSENGDEQKSENDGKNKEKRKRKRKKNKDKKQKEEPEKEEEVEEEEKQEEEKKEENPYLLTKKEGSFDEKTTIFVGQLPKTTTSNDLKELFKYPISRIKIMKFKDTKKPMGAAFVEFHDEKSFESAVQRNGEIFQGRRLKINASGSKPTSEGKKVHSRDRDQRLLYVGNLNFKTNEHAIRQLFRKSGKILKIDIPLLRSNGKKRGFAIIEYDDPKSIEAALKLNKTTLDGRELNVELLSNTKSPAPNANVTGQKRKRTNQ